MRKKSFTLKNRVMLISLILSTVLAVVIVYYLELLKDNKFECTRARKGDSLFEYVYTKMKALSKDSFIDEYIVKDKILCFTYERGANLESYIFIELANSDRNYGNIFELVTSKSKYKFTLTKDNVIYKYIRPYLPNFYGASIYDVFYKYSEDTRDDLRLYVGVNSDITLAIAVYSNY